MAKYKNNRATKMIGNLIKTTRIAKELEIEDIAQMTGFTYNTVKSIEDGNETGISYIIEIALAIGVHPKDILDIPLKIKPRFELSPVRQEKTRLTMRINKLVEESFFKHPKFAVEVCEKLDELYSSKTKTKSVSVILSRLVDNGILTSTKVGTKNSYKSRK